VFVPGAGCVDGTGPSIFESPQRLIMIWQSFWRQHAKTRVPFRAAEVAAAVVFKILQGDGIPQEDLAGAFYGHDLRPFVRSFLR